MLEFDSKRPHADPEPVAPDPPREEPPDDDPSEDEPPASDPPQGDPERPGGEPEYLSREFTGGRDSR